ncbi:hypothetical protein ACFL6U_07645 [Planctomycetota bacterium]
MTRRHIIAALLGLYGLVTPGGAAFFTISTGALLATPAYGSHEVLENFESYTNDDTGAVWLYWFDGYGHEGGNESGSSVGYVQVPYLETDPALVHTGSQSCPLQFDNDGKIVDVTGKTVDAQKFSEITYTYPTSRDFSTLTDGRAAGALGLSYRGPEAIQGMGSVSYDAVNHVYTVRGVGADAVGAKEQLTYAYTTLKGDCSLVVKLNAKRSNGVFNSAAQMGLMIREGLEAGARYALCSVTAAYNANQDQTRVLFRNRQEREAGSGQQWDAVEAQAMPLWMKLVRKNNVFTAFYSNDGVNWLPIDTQELVNDPDTRTAHVAIAMTADVYVGLSVCPHVDDHGATWLESDFTEFEVTGQVIGDSTLSQSVDIGLGNSAEPLYVALKDSYDHVGIANLPAEAIQATSWQTEEFDLAGFTAQGVNIRSIKTLMLGVGDRNTPVAGSSGVVFVDDIHLIAAD